MHALNLETIVVRLFLLLVLGIFASGCAFGGRVGISANPTELGDISTYQVRLGSEMGDDQSGGVLLYQEIRAGAGSLGVGMGLKFPIYIESEQRTYYVAPAGGMTVGGMRGEDRSGLDLRLGLGLADRRNTCGGALERLFTWCYDTRTMSVEVSQVVNAEGFLPTSLVLSVGRVH